MNENLNLVEILKDCPKDTKLYLSVIDRDVTLLLVKESREYPIRVIEERNKVEFDITRSGNLLKEFPDGEIVLFPSKDQRDWSKFTAPWYKKDKFDPKTLKPFDKVLVRDNYKEEWSCNFFSHISNDDVYHPYITFNIGYIFCIPYNEDTKHLVGTKEEAPEYYRYWGD